MAETNTGIATKGSRGMNVRYAFLNALYWMMAAPIQNFATIYLLDKGLSNTLIGIFLCVTNIVAIVSQSLVASYMDRSAKFDQKTYISIAFAATAVLTVFLLFHRSGASVPVILAFMLVFVFCVTIPSFINGLPHELGRLGYRINFGVCRGIGSICFALTALVIGFFLEKVSAAYLPAFYLVFSIAGFVVIRLIPMPEDVVKEAKTAKKLSLPGFFRKYRSFSIVLLGCILMSFNMALLFGYFIHIVEYVGGSYQNVGIATFIQSGSELPVLFLLGFLLEKFDVDDLMAFSAISYIVRALIYLVSTNVYMLYFAGVFQSVTYGLFAGASVYYVAKHVEEMDQNQGQALMVAAVTVSSVIASLIGGWMFDHVNVRLIILIGFLVTLTGSLLVILTVAKEKRKKILQK